MGAPICCRRMGSRAAVIRDYYVYETIKNRTKYS